MRALTYWLASVFLAVLASRAAERGDDLVAWVDSSATPLLSVPDSGRSALLGIGVLAMAYTYRQAWLNWRKRS